MATNLISVSSAPVAGFGDKEYYDLVGTIDVMRRVSRESVVDGFELQLEPEWDQENPPLTDRDWADWAKTPKYSSEEIAEFIGREKFRILSVHASRDVGSYLCSKRKRDWEKGERVIHDSLMIAERLGAEVCVFHLWDTWKESFDVCRLAKIFLSVADQFPKLKASVENIPTKLKGSSPRRLVEYFGYVTLDLRWAALHNELEAFESLVKKTVNVHLRGKVIGGMWVLERSDFGFYEALNKIRSKWRYSGLLTVEPEGRIDGSLLPDFLRAMRSLRD